MVHRHMYSNIYIYIYISRPLSLFESRYRYKAGRLQTHHRRRRAARRHYFLHLATLSVQPRLASHGSPSANRPTCGTIRAGGSLGGGGAARPSPLSAAHPVRHAASAVQSCVEPRAMMRLAPSHSDCSSAATTTPLAGVINVPEMAAAPSSKLCVWCQYSPRG